MGENTILDDLNIISEELDRRGHRKESNAIINVMKRIAFEHYDPSKANKEINNVLQSVDKHEESPSQARKQLSPFKGKINFEDKIDQGEKFDDAKMPESMDFDTPCGCSEPSALTKETHIFLSSN